MTDNNALPDFWSLYWEAERFLETLPQTTNTLDIYDKIYREQEEERLAEFYGYNEYDIDDLNNRDLLDQYHLDNCLDDNRRDENINTNEHETNHYTSDESDHSDFETV